MPLSDWFYGNDSTGAAAWTDVVAERVLNQNYVVKALVGRSLAGSYKIQGSLQQTYASSYQVRALVAKSIGGSYTITGGVRQTYASTFAVRGQPTNILQLSFKIDEYVGGGTGNSAPTNLNVSQIGSNQALMTWETDTAKDSYKVYSGSSGSGPFTLTATLGNVLTYTYTGLQPARPLYFTVSAVLAGVESAKFVPGLAAVIPPSITLTSPVMAWPTTITGSCGPSQAITVSIGTHTKQVTASPSGTYSVSFGEADSIQNGDYDVFVTATYGVNQNITAASTITISVPIVVPPVDPNDSAQNFWFFLGF